MSGFGFSRSPTFRVGPRVDPAALVERLALEAAARAEVEQPAGWTGRSMSACLRWRVEFVNAGHCPSGSLDTASPEEHTRA